MAEAALKIRVNLDRAAVLFLSGEAGMKMLDLIFQGFGAREPYRCTTKDKALQVCRESDLDLIVCDGSLPGGEAYAFVEALRRSDMDPNRFCPVLMVQGHTPVDMVCRARDCGANFVVAKPITPAVLLERVMWIAQETRPFVELETYVGPDRRFKNIGPPPESGRGRRRTDWITPQRGGTAVSLKEALI